MVNELRLEITSKTIGDTVLNPTAKQPSHSAILLIKLIYLWGLLLISS